MRPGRFQPAGTRAVSLYVQTAAPSHLWTVICRAGCVCVGEGCPCGMPVRLEGVGHIWDRHAPLVELALAGAVAPYDNTHRGDIDNIALPGLEVAS